MTAIVKQLLLLIDLAFLLDPKGFCLVIYICRPIAISESLLFTAVCVYIYIYKIYYNYIVVSLYVNVHMAHYGS